MDRPAGKACLSDYVSDGDVTEVLCALFPRTVGTMCAAASIWHPILFFFPRSSREHNSDL